MLSLEVGRGQISLKIVHQVSLAVSYKLLKQVDQLKEKIG